MAIVKAIGGRGGPCKIVYDGWYKKRQNSVGLSGHISDGLSVVLVVVVVAAWGISFSCCFKPVS